MKRMLAILLTLAMLLSLAACGGSVEEDPNAGKYLGTTAKAFGMVMPMSDIYEGETWLELKSGGKGTIMLDGDDFPMKWTLEGNTFTLTIDGEDSVGTLEDGVIVLDLMDMGVEMTFLKEGAEMPVAAATYNDAGYYDLIRIDGATAEDSVSEEDLTMLRELGTYMYLELLEDGTGMLFMDEEMPVTWADGTVNFTEDGLSVSYTLDGDILTLDMLESVLVFRKGEKPVATEPVETEPPVVSEMEQAGFTEFMEVGVPYPYTTICGNDETKNTTGELTVTSYEIVGSAEDLEAKEGYEWRVVTMEARFFDDNAATYGPRPRFQTEDYYNTKLHDDSLVYLEEGVNWKDDHIADLETYTVIHQGQEMEAFCRRGYKWSGWIGHENTLYVLWAFQLPVGYDGAVVGFADLSQTQKDPDAKYITDHDPSCFLLFRLN